MKGRFSISVLRDIQKKEKMKEETCKRQEREKKYKQNKMSIERQKSEWRND